MKLQKNKIGIGLSFLAEKTRWIAMYLHSILQLFNHSITKLMALKTGDKAPGFKLYNTEKQEVSLDDFNGKNVVLLFFPQAFTRVCTAELCSTRDDIAFYQELDAEVVALSVDSVNTLAKYKEDQNLNFTLLSDFNKEISRAYDALYEVWALNMKGVSKRAAFVIDKSGIIRYAEVLDNPGNLPNFDAVKKKLSSLS
jgi:glutaredoxin-dependent peroxiredoxin